MYSATNFKGLISKIIYLIKLVYSREREWNFLDLSQNIIPIWTPVKKNKKSAKNYNNIENHTAVRRMTNVGIALAYKKELFITKY